MARVEIYTTRWCPYCIMAKRLLDKKQVDYEEIRVDGKPQLRSAMTERAGGRTSVPQIFINNQHIGGCDDLTELEMDDGLEPLLQMEAS